MLFVWNGKEASPLIKAMSLTWGFELDSLLNKTKGTLLEFFFTGGVIWGTKIQRGTILIFPEVDSQKSDREKKENPNSPSSEEVVRTYETVYIFQFLIPREIMIKEQTWMNEQKNRYPKFTEVFLTKNSKEMNRSYLSWFQMIEDDEEEKYEVPFKSVPKLVIPDKAFVSP